MTIMLPRRTPLLTDNADDDIQISELLRTGEASRLRRRGAIHGHGGQHTRPSYVTLTCGRLIGAGWKFNSRHSFSDDENSCPLPQRSANCGRTVLVNIVEPSTSGCGAVITTRALPSKLYDLFEDPSTVDKTAVAPLDPTYLDEQQRNAVDEVLESSWIHLQWLVLGCRICGNVVGFRYRDIDKVNDKGQSMFFPFAVTSSKPRQPSENQRDRLSSLPDVSEGPAGAPIRPLRAGSLARHSVRHVLPRASQESPSLSRASSTLDYFDFSTVTRDVSRSDNERVTIVDTEVDTESSDSDGAMDGMARWTDALPQAGLSSRRRDRHWNSSGESALLYEPPAREPDERYFDSPLNAEATPFPWEGSQAELAISPRMHIVEERRVISATSPVVEDHGRLHRDQRSTSPLSPRPVAWSPNALDDIIPESRQTTGLESAPLSTSPPILPTLSIPLNGSSVPSDDIPPENALSTSSSSMASAVDISHSQSVTTESSRITTAGSEPANISNTTIPSPIEVFPPSRPSSVHVRISSHPRPPRETPFRERPLGDIIRRHSLPIRRGGSAPPMGSHFWRDPPFRPIIPPPPPSLATYFDVNNLRRRRVVSHSGDDDEPRDRRSQSRSWRARHDYVMRSREANDEPRRQVEFEPEFQTDSEPELSQIERLGLEVDRTHLPRQEVPAFTAGGQIRSDVRRSSSAALPSESRNSFSSPATTRRMTMPEFSPAPRAPQLRNDDSTSSTDSEDACENVWWRTASRVQNGGYTNENKDEEDIPTDDGGTVQHIRPHEAYLPFEEGSD